MKELKMVPYQGSGFCLGERWKRAFIGQHCSITRVQAQAKDTLFGDDSFGDATAVLEPHPVLSLLFAACCLEEQDVIAYGWKAK